MKHPIQARRSPQGKGQPLLVLVLILAGWVCMRALMLGGGMSVWPRAVQGGVVQRVPARAQLVLRSAPVAVPLARPVAGSRPSPRALRLASPSRPVPSRSVPEPANAPGPDGVSYGLTGGHPSLSLAGISYVDPGETARMVDAPPVRPPPARAVRSASSRWSGDGWVLWRRGQGAAPLTSGAASYGGSQFGAVVRYDLAPASARHPYAYLRVAGAIGAAFRDRHAALGFAVRPLPALPVAVLAEARAQQGSTAMRVRPAVALVSQLPPRRLPLGAEAEVYGQAGWIGGRDATGFFDVQALADRGIARPFPQAELRAGAGVWSGGQRGAARLDVGPRVSLRATIAGTPARVALDWRFRVAGDAEPGAGPALTVTMGF